MSDQDASSGEMRWLPNELDESLLDLLLNGQPLPTDAPAQARVVAEMLACLAAPADPGELAGEAAARFEFARGAHQAATSPSIQRPARRRKWSWLPPRMSARLIAGLVAAAIGAGGAAAAAYAGVLPDPIQDLAHYLLHVPDPSPASRHKSPHPASRKAHASPQRTRRRPAPGKDSTNPSRRANRPGKPNHHRKANLHRKANSHRKGNPHRRANHHSKGRHNSAATSRSSYDQEHGHHGGSASHSRAHVRHGRD